MRRIGKDREKAAHSALGFLLIVRLMVEYADHPWGLCWESVWGYKVKGRTRTGGRRIPFARFSLKLVPNHAR